jgi:hypothetical protein
MLKSKINFDNIMCFLFCDLILSDIYLCLYSGPPNNDCQDELLLVVSDNSNQMAGLLFLVSFVALLGFGVSFAIYYVKN